MCPNAAGRAEYFTRFLKAPAHTAYPTHYLSFKSGLLKKVSAHTASKVFAKSSCQKIFI
jgi:hypothetical protein